MKGKISYLTLFFLILIVFEGCKKTPPIPTPTITSINPTSGVAGISITITGTNFDAVATNNIVKFNGVSATITSGSTTSLIVTAPLTGSSGTISVTTLGGTATGPTFTYLQPPTIVSINPSSGNATTIVTITGTNFKTTASGNTVKFNGVTAIVQSATATTLTVAAPVSTTGIVNVSTSDGTVIGPTFTYLPLPIITSINPIAAIAGATVTITGTNFDAIAANDIVNFNGVNAIITAASTTQLVATVPATGTTGNITVSTLGGTSNGIAFTYLTAPTIYACGEQTNGNDGYWKNSKFNTLNNASSYPWAITGSGTDIYVAGPIVSSVTSPRYPTYWKNGAAVQLSNQSGGFLTSIFLSGTDVYCLGTIDGQAINVWKNGAISTLTINTYAGGASFASGNSAMFVSSVGDVYVAGYQSIAGNPWYQKATYWKNGVPSDLTNGSIGNARATAIFVSGNDVYVGGYEEVKNGVSIIALAPRLWKNGISIPLNTPIDNQNNSINALLVIGTDVYVGGQYNGSGAVWKNGTMINTTSYAVAEQVTSFFIYNNTDLYASGSSNVWGMNGYWVNGNFVEMDPGCTTASNSCAVTTANQVRGIYVK